MEFKKDSESFKVYTFLNKQQQQQPISLRSRTYYYHCILHTRWRFLVNLIKSNKLFLQGSKCTVTPLQGQTRAKTRPISRHQVKRPRQPVFEEATARMRFVLLPPRRYAISRPGTSTSCRNPMLTGYKNTLGPCWPGQQVLQCGHDFKGEGNIYLFIL